MSSTNEHSLVFKRYYDSNDRSATKLNRGWRHSFSRSIRRVQSSSTYKAFAASADTSSLYNDEASACTSGFAEIKSRVSTWANASAAFTGNACRLSIGTTSIGTLPLYYTSLPTPAPGTTSTISYEVIRDDGQVVSFSVEGTSAVSPPGSTLTLQATGSGYTLTDANDVVEAYDTNGKLLSATSRSGTVQTMGYDGSGKLSTVSDSFGHSLALSYDSQGRPSAVTRQ
jgi:YD repeat-containing protein